MSPTIKNNTIIHIEKRPFYLEGDIIAYYANKIIIVHRIIRKVTSTSGDMYYLTKGDNALYCDGKIYPARIIGEVCMSDCLVSKKRKKVLLFLQNLVILTYNDSIRISFFVCIQKLMCWIIYAVVHLVLLYNGKEISRN